jgi:hemerythrin-like domain-containing protein
MRAIVQSLRRDQRDIEQLLNILEQECDLFRRAERPDYGILVEIIDYFQSYLGRYYHSKEDLMFSAAKRRDATSARIVGDIVAERTSSLLKNVESGLILVSFFGGS